jgi:hypothetical protein
VKIRPCLAKENRYKIAGERALERVIDRGSIWWDMVFPKNLEGWWYGIRIPGRYQVQECGSIWSDMVFPKNLVVWYPKTHDTRYISRQYNPFSIYKS